MHMVMLHFNLLLNMLYICIKRNYLIPGPKVYVRIFLQCTSFKTRPAVYGQTRFYLASQNPTEKFFSGDVEVTYA
jgi:hypothetical protein